MATTPPPLPSSDEGEFDDDDFGCFTSSAPINAGLESDSEDDNHHLQECSDQKDAVNNVIKNVPVMQMPESITNLDDESNLPDVICNGKQESATQPGGCPPGISIVDSNSAASESQFEKTTEENHSVEAEASADDNVKLNKTISLHTVIDSSSHIAAPISNHSFELRDNSSTEENIVSESCVSDSDKEKWDFNSSEIKDLQSQQAEVDDWADFSSAPSDVVQLALENQVKEVTVGTNVDETFQPSNQIDQPSDVVDITTVNHDEYDLQSEVVKSENIEKDIESMNTFCEPTEHDIKDSCDISSNDQNSSFQTAEDVENIRSDSDEVGNVENIGSDGGGDIENIKSDSSDEGDVENIRSGCDEGEEVKNSSSEKQSLPESNSDFEVQSEKNSNFAQSMKETSKHSDNIGVPITHKNDNVDDDDDDFGDFSDFTSDKVKESVSNEDVVPISFRTSTCEDGMEGEEEEDHNNFDNNKKTFDAQTGVGESPSPCDDNGEDGEEDWGFKAADDPPKRTEREDQFGDFGSNNQSHADDADWADFNESSAPKEATSEEVAHVNEDEFQSPASSSSVMTSSQQSLSKLEKAISSSFPADHQMDFHQFEREDHKNNTGQENDDHATEKDDMHGLDAVVSMGLKVLPTAKQETWTITKEIRIKDPMIRIWERLKDVNACHALDFGWTSSQCSQDVYNTLHIDTQNVLFSQKKQAVPFFASGLGILEPIRGGSNQPEKQNTQPPLLDTSKPEDSQKEQVQDIPPVDFDWSSSGLTDPLKVFKADNFNSGLSSFEPFAEILQKSGMARQGSTEKELSTEAKSILKKIPNLRFMQSKVLMFPIKDS